MLDVDTLVFIEVRYRKSNHFGGAAASVDTNKQRKLVFTANHFLQANPSSQPMRFDVIALTPDEPPNWIINAFMES